MSPEMSFGSKEQHRPYSVVIPDVSRVDWANTISVLTTQAHDKGDMLAKTPQEVLELFKKKHSIVLIDNDGNLLSHAGATFEYPDGSIEVGALCTSEEAQGNGYGRTAVEELLGHLKKLYPERKIFALANKASEGLFKKVGGVEIPISELHKDVFEACKDCLRRPNNSGGGHKCCDTPYNLTNFFTDKPVSVNTTFGSRPPTNGANGAIHAKI